MSSSSLNNCIYESGYESLHAEEQLRKLSIVKAEMLFSMDDCVLDVGCGTGLSYVLGCRLVGVDSSGEMVKLCNERFPAVQGSAECLPFPDNSFDAVICMTAIHLFPDIAASIDEMRRVSMRSVIISVLRRSRLFGLTDRLIRNKLSVQKVVSESIDNVYFCSV